MRPLVTTTSALLATVLLVPNAIGSDALVIHEAGRPDSADSSADVVGESIHSDAWLSLETDYLHRLKLPWRHRSVLVGAGLDIPLLLWGVTGDPDTLRISIRGTAQTYRLGWLALVVDVQSRLGVQDSVLDTSVGWDFQLTVSPSLARGSWSISPFVAVRQGIATHVANGEIVHDAFEELYPEGHGGVSGPKDGWIAGGNTRIPFGLAFGVELPRRLALYGSAGLIWTHSSLGVGMFDAMMLGYWPFSVDLGVRRRF